jgi:hypothetical protein
LIWPVCANAGIANSSAEKLIANIRRIMRPLFVDETPGTCGTSTRM